MYYWALVAALHRLLLLNIVSAVSTLHYYHYLKY